MKPIEVGKAPTGPGFQSWLVDLYMECCAASNRSRRRTMRYLKAVEVAKAHTELESVTKKGERFDAELTAACFRFALRETLRKLKIYRSALQKSGGEPPGRASVWFILQKYVVEAGAL